MLSTVNLSLSYSSKRVCTKQYFCLSISAGGRALSREETKTFELTMCLPGCCMQSARSSELLVLVSASQMSKTFQLLQQKFEMSKI